LVRGAEAPRAGEIDSTVNPANWGSIKAEASLPSSEARPSWSGVRMSRRVRSARRAHFRSLCVVKTPSPQ
jgi:hypothetical protein